MKTIHITEDETFEVQGSPLAIIEYQRGFSENGAVPNWYSDYKDAAPAPDGGYGIAGFDNVFLAKTAWAMANNAARVNGAPKMPPFEEWFDSHPQLALPAALWKMEVLAAIGEELFLITGEKGAEGDAGE